MLEFGIALTQALVEVPQILVPGEDASGLLHIDGGHVQQRYRALALPERQWFVDCWHVYQVIVARQNEVHSVAVQLASEMLHMTLGELFGSGERDENAFGTRQELRDRLWRTVRELSHESLLALVERARELAAR